jgi:imidazolonepropionase-like amidohydrolase
VPENRLRRRSKNILTALAVAAAAAAGLLATAVYVLAVWPLRDPHPVVHPGRGVLALRGARIYVSPDVAPLDGADLVVRDGRIAAIGHHLTIPPDARVLACDGCVVTAGFWNNHVHFTERQWQFSDWKSAAVLQRQIDAMLSSRGFTTAIDTGSDLRVTIPLRRRIESAELRGPRILTAGAAQYPPNGIPYYLRDSLPRLALYFLPQPASPDAAAAAAERNIAQGADLLKLFTGSYVARGRVLVMPEANAAAAVAVAHRHGQLAFAHPSDRAGVEVALRAGVDVLAHAADSSGGIDAALLQRLVDRHMAMIPTLLMFASTVSADRAYLGPIEAEVARFHALGGQLLFGTDVGYLRDYDTRGEFTALARCGLGAMDILRMLTTAPAERFRVDLQFGRVAVGQIADLVILGSDPAADVVAFADVRQTVRAGRVIYSRIAAAGP